MRNAGLLGCVVALPETWPTTRLRKLLTFAFCSPIVRGGRGNGKRVARRFHCRSGSHEPACGKQDGRRPLKVPSRKRGEGSAARRSLDSEPMRVIGLLSENNIGIPLPFVDRCAVTVNQEPPWTLSRVTAKRSIVSKAYSLLQPSRLCTQTKRRVRHPRWKKTAELPSTRIAGRKKRRRSKNL